jgi:hypothetical protein
VVLGTIKLNSKTLIYYRLLHNRFDFFQRCLAEFWLLEICGFRGAKGMFEMTLGSSSSVEL